MVYRSPNASEEQTDKLVELVKMAGKSSLLIGDFNLPAINWKDGTAAGPTARKFLEASQDADMDQLVTFPTHARGNILDLLLTNNVGSILEISDLGRLGNSDHTMILVTVQTERRSSSRTVETVSNWGES